MHWHWHWHWLVGIDFGCRSFFLLRVTVQEHCGLYLYKIYLWTSILMLQCMRVFNYCIWKTVFKLHFILMSVNQRSLKMRRSLLIIGLFIICSPVYPASKQCYYCQRCGRGRVCFKHASPTLCTKILCRDQCKSGGYWSHNNNPSYFTYCHHLSKTCNLKLCNR